MTVNIKVHNLSFQYHAEPILKGISMEVEKGDILGIIGPNGSGKSTLLKNINALLRPMEGTVMLEGKDLLEMNRQEIARYMAVVPQDTSVGFNFNAYEIVMMGRVPHLDRFQKEGKRDRQIVREAMELTSSWSFKNRPITELSGGERQRVILARALAQESQVILLDEPTAFLDISYQTEIFDLVKKLNQERNLTVIAVLHDLNLASQYCHHLLLLKEGKIYRMGTPREVITTSNIREVYGTRVIVGRHPLSGTPYVSLLPGINEKNGGKKSNRVHVIGGGGSASPLLKLLYSLGHQVSVGVINAGDSDWETARELGVPCVEEVPFSSLSKERHQDNLKMIEEAELVIMANVPFGRGNLKNLEAGLHALDRGIPLLVYKGNDISSRDYTGGKAVKLYLRLKENGAREVYEEEELMEVLE